MKAIPQEISETMDRLHTFIDRTVPIKIGYLLFILFLRKAISYPIPNIVTITVSIMILSAIALAFYFEKYPSGTKTIINTFFFYTLFDLLLLTIVIHFLAGIEFIYYTFYIVLGFVFFSQRQAIFLTLWTIILFVGLIFLKYLQIIPDISLISPQEQGLHNFLFVLTTTTLYTLSLCFLGFLSYGFYQMMTKRIDLSKKTQIILEREKGSLEIRVRARRRELDLERKSLEKKINQRKKELEEENQKLEGRAEELTKFQKVTLGRELKMQELEKKITWLKAKLKSKKN